jgi:hypothetical protein
VTVFDNDDAGIEQQSKQSYKHHVSSRESHFTQNAGRNNQEVKKRGPSSLRCSFQLRSGPARHGRQAGFASL